MAAHIARRVAAIAALGAIAGIGWAVVTASTGLPGYTPARHFISLLAVPRNPMAPRVNDAFVIGGLVLAAAFGVLAALAPASSGRGWPWGLGLAAATGVAVAFVGWFPVTAPVPHFGFAIAAGGLALAACVVAARAVTGVARTLAIGFVGLQLALLGAGVVHLAIVIGRTAPNSLNALLHLPQSAVLLQIHDTALNPLAVVEWIVFAIAGGFAVVASLAQLSSRPVAGGSPRM